MGHVLSLRRLPLLKWQGQSSHTVLHWEPQKTSCDVRQPAIPKGGPKMHISDVSCHYQAIIISSSEDSACQSLWHAFSLSQWYAVFICFSTARVLDRFNHFQCQSPPCWMSVWLFLITKQLSPCSMKVQIKISWQVLLSFGIPWTFGHWCAQDAASHRAISWRLWNVVEIGWPGGLRFQPGAGIKADRSKFFSDLSTEICFS